MELTEVMQPAPHRYHSEGARLTLNDWETVAGLSAVVIAILTWIYRKIILSSWHYLRDFFTLPTNNRRTLELVRQIQNELAHTHALGVAIPDLIDLPVWVADADGQIVRVNDYMCRLLARPMADFMGERWRAIIHADDSPTVYQQWSAAVQYRMDFSMKFSILHSDGRTVPVWCNSRVLTSGDGGCAGWIGRLTVIID